MKLRQLEIKLEKIEGFEDPVVEKEQYQTPAPLAARVLYHAMTNGDIGGRTVCDLGCGTGILSIGALLLGASEVTGIDTDGRSLELAQKNSEIMGVGPHFIRGEINSSCTFGTFDTAVMNPPFGAQKRHADRAFIDCAIRSAGEIYTIANSGSLPFITSYTDGRAVIREVIQTVLTLRRTYHFHRREKQDIPVEIVHMSRL